MCGLMAITRAETAAPRVLDISVTAPPARSPSTTCAFVSATSGAIMKAEPTMRPFSTAA